MMGDINKFLLQRTDEKVNYDDTVRELIELSSK